MGGWSGGLNEVGAIIAGFPGGRRAVLESWGACVGAVKEECAVEAEVENLVDQRGHSTAIIEQPVVAIAVPWSSESVWCSAISASAQWSLMPSRGGQHLGHYIGALKDCCGIGALHADCNLWHHFLAVATTAAQTQSNQRGAFWLLHIRAMP